MISHYIKFLGVKLIHSASLLGGFSKGDISFVDKAFSDDTKEQKADDFYQSFEKLISDPSIIPSHSLIVLSQKVHYMEKLKRKAEMSFVVSEKRRKVAAEIKGQKIITDYFKTTKSAAGNASKKVVDERNYKLEEIILDKRGSESNIKILWIPKNEELDPVNYVSVMFCKDVAQTLEEEDYDLAEACKRALDLMPDKIWLKIMAYIESLEEMYINEDKPKENVVERTI